jgi:hypothetical protein
MRKGASRLSSSGTGESGSIAARSRAAILPTKPGERPLQRPIRPMGVVMVGVLAEGRPQVPFAGNQHLVWALSARRSRFVSSDVLALTATMKLDDLVLRALRFCPRAG